MKFIDKRWRVQSKLFILSESKTIYNFPVDAMIHKYFQKCEYYFHYLILWCVCDVYTRKYTFKSVNSKKISSSSKLCTPILRNLQRFEYRKRNSRHARNSKRFETTVSESVRWPTPVNSTTRGASLHVVRLSVWII